MPEEPMVLIEELATPVEDLWALWTDPEQVSTWLAGSATIDLRVGGTYLLSGHLASRPLAEPVGGAILGLEEEYVLKVAWQGASGPNAPPGTPATTWTLLFQPLGPNRTRLRLEQDGWDPKGAAVDRQRYAEMWGEVLARLKQKVA